MTLLGGSFDVVQADKYGALHKVGDFTNLTLTLNTSLLHFKDSDTIPISAIVLDTPNLDTVAGVIVFTLASLEIAVFLLSMVYFYLFRRNRVIRRSSPIFCQIVLVGMILVNVGLLVWTFDQTQFTCIVKVWISVIGFGLIIGSLLAKTYRIFRIFNHIRVKRTAIENQHLLWFSGVVVLFEIILLCIYTFTTGLPSPVFHVNPVNYLYSYIVCEVPNSGFQLAMTITILTINSILIILMSITAYGTRKVESSFNESFYIGITVRGSRLGNDLLLDKIAVF